MRKVNNLKQEEIKTKLDTINQSILGGGGSKKHTYKATITRPANATPYTAGDVIGDAVDGVLKTIADDIAKLNGSGVVIFRCRLQTNDTGLAGKPIDMHFYEETPDITGLADNAAMVLSDANASKRMGSMRAVFGSGIFSKAASNDYSIVAGNLADKKLRFIASAGADFTPSANSTWIQLTFDIEISNN